MRYLIIGLFSLFIVTGAQLSASIKDTKHNLSATSVAGTIKGTTEKEICIFCHIPHLARVEGSPLWNRKQTDSTYDMYDSDYLRRMGYPAVAADLGTQNDTPGAISRQCLSCHDGTVAVGSVYKQRKNMLEFATPIAMDGVAGDGTMPTTSAANLGTDLTTTHPIAIEYDNTIDSATTPQGNLFSDEVRGIELNDPTVVNATTSIKLLEYPAYPGKKYVECTSCHDPHKSNTKKFLRVDTGANHAQNVVNTCTSCHDKTNWIGSVHQNPPTTPADPEYDVASGVQEKYDTLKVRDLGCINCHTPHNALGGPQYLHRQVQANTCFQGAADTVATAACHGVGGVKDMQSILTRAYTHPVVESSDPAVPIKHTNLDILYGNGHTLVDPTTSKGISWDTNKHAVCMDCHNPHQARPGTHIADGSWYGAPGASTNAVSPVLTGVTGVEPTSWPAAWTQPLTFNVLNSAEKEYQICFKCHSYWGIGSATDGVNDGGHVSPSDGTTLLTDVAWDMNINNKSGHPVVINNAARPGSYDTFTYPAAKGGGTDTGLRSLQPDQLLSPWTENPGLNTMYCSDCHGADNELGGDPKGPHGSDLKYILKGVNQQWPHKADGVTLYDTDDIRNATDTDLFCKNCHDVQKPHKDWWNTMANKNYSCVTCHVGVPHGSSVSRLIGYWNFPAPYNYNGNSLKMQGYRKNLQVNDSSDVWASGSQSGDATCDGSKCHRTDDSINGAYDANLLPFP